LEYRGTDIRIEGGQSYINLPAFQGALFAAIMATAKDPARTAALVDAATAAGYPAGRAKDDFAQAAATAQATYLAQQHVTGTTPGLHHPKMQSRILRLCDGVTIRICRLLEAAAIRAIVTGRERIDLELLTDDLATSSLVSIADRRMRRPTG
jgi:hypothetical protein